MGFSLHDVVPRMLGEHGEHRTVSMSDVEHWISSGSGTEVTDEVTALLMVAASQHQHAGRRALADSLRQHACELLRPSGSEDAHLRLVDDVLD